MPQKGNDLVKSTAKAVECLLVASLALVASSSATLARGAARQYWGGNLMMAPQPRCRTHYAGQCDVNDPCALHGLKDWRYGGQRDFECFIVDE